MALDHLGRYLMVSVAGGYGCVAKGTCHRHCGQSSTGASAFSGSAGNRIETFWGRAVEKVTHGDLFDNMGCCIHSRLRQLGRGIPVWQTVWRSMSRSSGMANDKNAHPAMDKLHLAYLAIKHRDVTMKTRAGSNFKICDWSLNIKAAMLDGLRIFPWRTWFPNTHMEVEMGVPQIIHFKRTFH